MVIKFSGNGYCMRGEMKSAGERTIADFLTNIRIKYNYEPAVLINDSGYNRIWYPDFGLPDYSVFIEYFGIKNDPVYDKETDYKLDAYSRNGIDVIPVYPSTLRGNFQGYILGEVYRTTNNRLLDLEEKIFRFEKLYRKPQGRNKRNYSQPGKRYRRSGKY